MHRLMTLFLSVLWLIKEALKTLKNCYDSANHIKEFAMCGKLRKFASGRDLATRSSFDIAFQHKE